MFISVKKFNELAAENEALKAAVTAAEQQRDSATATAADNATKLAAETARANDLAAKLAEKTTAHDALIEGAAKLAADVERRANILALEKTQAQGTPPVSATPDTQTAGSTMREQFMAITDPQERGKFWAKNKDAILSGK